LASDLLTLFVSHRFSTVRQADRIIVLDGGTVVEDGTHDALAAGGGLYARMFEAQAEQFVASAEEVGS
jgi:ATP-binding cassette, subfamily B, bacterial